MLRARPSQTLRLVVGMLANQNKHVVPFRMVLYNLNQALHEVIQMKFSIINVVLT